MVRKKMLRGYDPAQIAEVLEEEPEKVEKICRILKAEGMEVSDEEIYRKYREDDSANEWGYIAYSVTARPGELLPYGVCEA